MLSYRTLSTIRDDPDTIPWLLCESGGIARRLYPNSYLCVAAVSRTAFSFCLFNAGRADHVNRAHYEYNNPLAVNCFRASEIHFSVV